MTEKIGETCADGGKCHHKCKEKCFRREHCSPFIDYQGPWKYEEPDVPVEPNLVVTRSPDANVERNRELLLQRSIAGLAKYGVTTERNDLTLSQWLQHALEEVLDLANYLQAAKTQIERDKKPRRELLELAEAQGARITGTPDGREPIEVVFSIPAWRAFDAALQNQDL